MANPDTESASEAGSSDRSAEGGRKRRFRWWMPVVGVVALVVLGFGVVLFQFVTRDEPGAVPVEEALEDFRQSTATSTGEASGLRPPAGVYSLTGEGREEISFPPVDQQDGETIPATVEHQADGCWTFRIDYNEAHWQDWTLCPSGDGLVQPLGHTYQAWDFGTAEIGNLATFECEADTPFIVTDLDPDESVPRRCIGTNEQVSGTTDSRGTLTFVGTDTLEVGGVQVEAWRFRQNAEFSGAQTGTEEVDFWFAVEDGMPLRGERSVAIGSESPVGTIDYTEEGWWQLASLEPQR